MDYETRKLLKQRISEAKRELAFKRPCANMGCDNRFVKKNGAQRYCSDACRREANRTVTTEPKEGSRLE